MEQMLKQIGAGYKRFRDPLYGYIHISKKELSLVDTPLFQRLRRIHQLALTKYVYPTAEHSRFVHSIGVMHCATSMFIGLSEHELSQFNEAEKLNDLRLLRYAGLLHDIGHLPFSHAAEKELLGGSSHEELGQYLVLNYPKFIEVLGDDAKLISSILSKEVKAKYNLVHQIVSGQLDSDRADYLMRDSHACGVKYGEYDRNRYMQAFGVLDSESVQHLCVNERDIFVVEGFLMARYHYNLQVPYHRTRTGYDLVLKKYFGGLRDREKIPKFFEKNEEGKICAIDIQTFESFDDYQVYEWIKEDYRQNDPWATILLRLDHLRPVLDISDEMPNAKEKFKKLITVLEEKGKKRGEDFFADRIEVEVSKLGRKPEEGQADPGQERPSVFVRRRDQSLVDIAKYSRLVGKLNKPLTLYRVFAPKWTFDQIAKIKEKVLKNRPANHHEMGGSHVREG